MPAKDKLGTVKRCLDAYERFVMTAAISLGLLQLIALKYRCSVWNQFEGYLRTRSRALPSERTVKAVTRNLLIRNLLCFASDGIIHKIQNRYGKVKNAFQGKPSSSEIETAIPPS